MDKNSTASSQHQLISEEPLKIIIEDRLYSIVMRTPQDELALAAGLCFSDGIVNKIDDIKSLSFSDKADNNNVIISLDKTRRNEI